jgi:hypothetical protein
LKHTTGDYLGAECLLKPLEHIYVYEIPACVVLITNHYVPTDFISPEKKPISTSNCLEPGGSLKFFHPPKLGALFDFANFQIPGRTGFEF